MNVVLVTHGVGLHDGQSGVNHAVVRMLLRRGGKVTLVATTVSADILAMPGVTWVPITLGKVPTALLQHQLFALKSYLWLRRNRQRFDVVHVNGFITWGRADLNAVHFVHTGWLNSGYYPFSWRRGAYGAYQEAYSRLTAILEKYAFARSRLLVAVSDRVAGELRDAGVKTDIDVIYNGSDLASFATAQPNRAAFALPENKFLCLFGGDIRISRKNLETVLQSLVNLPAHIEMAVGGSTKGSPYPEMAKALGIAERVHFLGHVRDVPTLMKSVDCLVFPSRYDPFALVILEAMAAGLPVVTCENVGASALVKECGVVLADPNDVAGVTAAVKLIESDPVVRARMQTMARIKALNYSSEAMGNRYVDVYEDLMADAKQTPPAPVRAVL